MDIFLSFVFDMIIILFHSSEPPNYSLLFSNSWSVFLIVIEYIFVYEYIPKYNLISLYASPMYVIREPFGIDNHLLCTFLEEKLFLPLTSVQVACSSLCKVEA